METEYSMEHLGISESLRKNLKLQYYEAGHMMYVRDEDSLNSKQTWRRLLTVLRNRNKASLQTEIAAA